MKKIMVLFGLAFLASVFSSFAQDPDTVWTHDLWQYKVIGKCLRFMPDGKTIIVGVNNTLYEFETSTGKLIRKFNADTLKGEVVFMEITKDGKNIVTKNSSGRLCLWDYGNGNYSNMINYKDSLNYIYGINFTPDGRKLFMTSNSNLIVFDMLSKTIERQIHWDNGWINKVSISKDGKYFSVDNQYIHPYDKLRHSKLQLWDITEFKFIKELDDVTRNVHSIEFSPNSKYLAFTTEENEGDFLRIYNLENGTKQIYPRGFFGYYPYNAIFLKNENYLIVSGSSDSFSKTKLLQIDSGKTIYTINYGGATNTMDMNKDNQLIFFDENGSLVLTNSNWIITKIIPRVENIHKEQIYLTYDKNQIIINNNNNELIKFINIFDINGRLVSNYNDSTYDLTGTLIKLPFNYQGGVYFCRVLTSANDYSIKFISEQK